ncbi:MAG: cbb3-type cytochrome oxidase assembly protein CcoS [Cyanobacteria bacterium]|nr:cbb3-type cytochrome oxidase assembly protein CcoS [Cyanobacteriota bacterium]
MCPNCVLNQAPLDTGLYVAFGVCFLFFIIGVAAMWWAFGNGEFEDIESSKFDMMDDGDDTAYGARAKQAVSKVRAAKSGG